MAVTITFHTFKEKKPLDGESIILLEPTYDFGFQGFYPKHCEAEYCWFELDEDGSETGLQISFDEADAEAPDGCVLRIIADRSIAQDDWLWISETDYWNCFPAEDE